VLCHELPYNVWGDHDDNVSIDSQTARMSPLTVSLKLLKELNSQLNREVADHEPSLV
jgi:hypothetical protein